MVPVWLVRHVSTPALKALHAQAARQGEVVVVPQVVLLLAPLPLDVQEVSDCVHRAVFKRSCSEVVARTLRENGTMRVLAGLAAVAHATRTARLICEVELWRDSLRLLQVAKRMVVKGFRD